MKYETEMSNNLARGDTYLPYRVELCFIQTLYVADVISQPS
jgi:hypothetical protein